MTNIFLSALFSYAFIVFKWYIVVPVLATHLFFNIWEILHFHLLHAKGRQTVLPSINIHIRDFTVTATWSKLCPFVFTHYILLPLWKKASVCNDSRECILYTFWTPYPSLPSLWLRYGSEQAHQYCQWKQCTTVTTSLFTISNSKVQQWQWTSLHQWE